MRASICTVLMAALLLAMPGSAKLQAEGDKQVIKISTIQTKTSELSLQEKRTNEKLAAATNGRIQIRFRVDRPGRVLYRRTSGDIRTEVVDYFNTPSNNPISVRQCFSAARSS